MSKLSDKDSMKKLDLHCYIEACLIMIEAINILKRAAENELTRLANLDKELVDT